MSESRFFDHLNISKSQQIYDQLSRERMKTSSLMKTMRERMETMFAKPSEEFLLAMEHASQTLRTWQIEPPSGKSRIMNSILSKMSHEERERITLHNPHHFGRAIDILPQRFDTIVPPLYKPWVERQIKLIASLSERMDKLPQKTIDHRYRSVRSAVNYFACSVPARLMSLHARRLAHIGRFSTKTTVFEDFYGKSWLKPKGYGLRVMVDEIRSKKSA